MNDLQLSVAAQVARLTRSVDDVHPFLVLSPRIFNERTSLVIGLPMTTAQCNSDNPFAIPVGKASGRKTGQTCYVLCHQPKSFDWRLRKAKTHPLGNLAGALFVQVCERLNQIIQLVRRFLAAWKRSMITCDASFATMPAAPINAKLW